MTGSLEADRRERVLHIPETAAETQGFDLVVSDTSFSFPFLMRGELRPGMALRITYPVRVGLRFQC
ncbi:Uncharacterized protein BANIM336_00389 [Bifidobacterium animalis subsp. animalis IM386]|uniref:Uncharacterized protein n=1 Tax=Bifidobacterium animalis subsp. animalis IM386 TaxID=1402194 RepID=A0AAV2W0P0_9BIFI|nr:hypothetical protein BANAN_00140 [Bifidobacterium animalis subsp. animalis ATCC 25527]CDI67080.1 Uncharacterized protein BANIM336_00389 [Bifidobacterium animalis subsp. animalis IM386]